MFAFAVVTDFSYRHRPNWEYSGVLKYHKTKTKSILDEAHVHHIIHVTEAACFSLLAHYLNLPSGINIKKSSKSLWALVIDGKSLECLLKHMQKVQALLSKEKTSGLAYPEF